MAEWLKAHAWKANQGKILGASAWPNSIKEMRGTSSARNCIGVRPIPQVARIVSAKIRTFLAIPIA